MTHTDDALVDGASLDEIIAAERARDPEFAAEWDKYALTEAVTDDALTERVMKILSLFRWEVVAKTYAQDNHDKDKRHTKPAPIGFSRTAGDIIAAVRAHDEQDALNCGHCDPNTDEIACACQIKERDDEQ